jgi:hypothetical protein
MAPRSVRLLRRWLARPRRERLLLVRAAALQGWCLAALRLVPLARVVRLMRLAAGRPRRADRAADVAKAVLASSRLFGEASTCLSRALTAQALIGGETPSTTVVGVALGPQGFSAHAWLERDGQVLLGAPEAPSYRDITRLETLS